MKVVITALVVVAMAGIAAAQAPASQAASPLAAGQFAYVDINRVASESDEGQAANARVEELSQQKVAEIEARNTEGQGELSTLNQEMLDAQQKLQSGQNVISPDAAATLQRQITRLQRELERATADVQADIQRMSQDAEAEVQELQQELQLEFERKLIPAIDQLAAAKQLAVIFNAQQGLVWADPSLDITQELIDILNNQTADTP